MEVALGLPTLARVQLRQTGGDARDVRPGRAPPPSDAPPPRERRQPPAAVAARLPPPPPPYATDPPPGAAPAATAASAEDDMDSSGWAAAARVILSLGSAEALRQTLVSATTDPDPVRVRATRDVASTRKRERRCVPARAPARPPPGDISLTAFAGGGEGVGVAGFRGLESHRVTDVLSRTAAAPAARSATLTHTRITSRLLRIRSRRWCAAAVRVAGSARRRSTATATSWARPRRARGSRPPSPTRPTPRAGARGTSCARRPRRPSSPRSCSRR